jgi:hypothetical protein
MIWRQLNSKDFVFFVAFLENMNFKNKFGRFSQIFVAVSDTKTWGVLNRISVMKISSKGQLNSEWIYEVIVSPKNDNQTFSRFLSW